MYSWFHVWAGCTIAHYGFVCGSMASIIVFTSQSSHTLYAILVRYDTTNNDHCTYMLIGVCIFVHMCKMVVITDAQRESSCCEIVCVKLGGSGIENKIAKRNGMNMRRSISAVYQ